MKFIKKIVTVVLALTMVFGLCACMADPIEANVTQDSAVYVPGEDDQNFISDFANFVQGGDDVLFFQSVTSGEQVESSLANYYVLDKSKLLEPEKQFEDISVLK